MKYTSIALLLATLALTSCLGDDRHSDYPSQIAFTTVSVSDKAKAGYYFTLDTHKTIHPGDTSRTGTYDTKDKEGKRAIIYYNLLEQPVEGFDYNAALYHIEDVLTKQVEVATTDEELKDFGDDPSAIEQARISGEFLDIYYIVPTDGSATVKHRLSLVENKTASGAEPGNEYTVLEFRHNANGDLSGKLAAGYVSFRLGDYHPSITKSKGVKLRITTLAGLTTYLEVKAPTTEK